MADEIETPFESEDEVDWAANVDAGEISELLGFDLTAEASVDRTGLRALVNSALVSPKRLPMLDVIFDRSARVMTSNLRQITDDNIEVSLDDVSATRFGDFLQSISGRMVIGVLKTGAGANHGLIAVDPDLVFSMVDQLLGGRRGGASTLGDRDFTPIELSLTERVLLQLVDAYCHAFQPVAPIEIAIDRIETTPRFAAIVQNASVCTLAKFRIEIGDVGGRAALLVPHAGLEPVKSALSREFIGDAVENDASWRDSLAREISASDIALDIVLAENEMTIGQLAMLGVGDTIKFTLPTRGGAKLSVRNHVVGLCEVGKIGDRIAVKVIDGASVAQRASEAASC